MNLGAVADAKINGAGTPAILAMVNCTPLAQARFPYRGQLDVSHVKGRPAAV
jgi:hypothetical protein